MEVNSKDEHKVRDIDAAEKNKFKFDWLSKTVKVTKTVSNILSEDIEVKVGDCFKKIEVSGKVLCNLCKDNIYYGKRGFAAISDHVKSKKHLIKEKTKRENFILPANFFSSLPSTSAVPSEPLVQPPINVPLCDRITNAQTLILGVMAENNLPFSISPVLIDLCKVLACDKKALNHLSMARTTASYKMRLGLSKTVINETVDNLQKCKFSLNIDEATSSNYKRVISILVSYFSPLINKVVVEHLASVNVFRVTAEAIFNEVIKVFEDNNIPWHNLMSVLMDSCNVMRGSKSGLEKRIQEKAPHLLDVDGDSCHHIHNAAKQFCKPFEGNVQKYLCDLHNDFKWSPDQKECLSEICQVLGIKYTSVENMVPHRWLSCYDVSLSNIRMLHAFTIFYYAFLPASDKVTYFSILCAIYKERGITAEGRTKVKEIHQYLLKKSYTAEGKARKDRIVSKLFFHRRKTLLVLNFFIAALPLLKKYVCLFQTKEPMIHKLHDEQEQLFLNFLSCFVKHEILKDKTVSQLINLDLSSDENLLKKRKMFLGFTTESIVEKNIKDVAVISFLNQASQAYIQCGQYLQKKLPLDNLLLKCISAIDPLARGHSVTADRLKMLPKLVKNVLSNEEEIQYALDVHLYQVDKCLPSHEDASQNILRIDVWWASFYKLKKYDALSKMVKALLSCFHGPQIESSFSMMGDILDKGSSNMKIETFSAIQTVKYKLLSNEKSAIDFFKKADYLHDPVEKNLCKNMATSYLQYKKELSLKEEKKKMLSVKENITSKQEDKKEICEKENKSRMIHKRKLEELARKKQMKKKKF